MEVCFLASGERVTVLARDDFAGKLGREVKRTLASHVCMTRFCLRLFADTGHEVQDHWMFAPGDTKVNLVFLQMQEPNAEQVGKMHNAADSNDVDAMERLLRLPLDPNVRPQVQEDEEVDTEEEHDTEEEEEEVILEPTLLHLAAGKGHLEMMRLLLEARAQVDAVSTTDSRRTPIHFAAWEGHVEAVRLLLKSGASPHQCGPSGRTPLVQAAWHGHLDVVRVLLDAGANADYVAWNGAYTPLYVAAADGYLDVVRLLLAQGVSLETASSCGTPLCIATANGQLEVAQCLLGARADVNYASPSGETPLFMAAQDGHLEVVRVLLESGADCTMATRGLTPMDAASKYASKSHRHREVADLLGKHRQHTAERPGKVRRTDRPADE